MRGFHTVVRHLGDAVVVGVQGELDAATAGQLSERCAALPPADRLVMDLSGCSFLDSSGFRALVIALRASASGSVVSPAATRAVRRVVDLLGLAALVPVHDDLAQALAGAAGSGSASSTGTA